jgi:hypothetical protein
MAVFSPEAKSVLHQPGAAQPRRIRPYLVLGGLAALAAAGLVLYACTQAFAWDEGFHLLAAQLIDAGKRPYLDFFHPQTPLYAYWNAFWMALFGQSWRVSHVVSALMTTGAVFLTADYVMTRLRLPGWQLYCAIVALLLVALNHVVIDFGTIGQAYGACLFFSVAAFRLAVVAVERRGPLLAAGGGFLASAAAACSLLAAPVVAVLFVWMIWYNRAGSRIRKSALFLGACVVPFLPWLSLLLQSPRTVLFDSIGFHMFYRTVEWEGAGIHNLEVATDWSNSGPALLLALLALVGFVYIVRLSDFDRRERSESYLCCWLVLVLTAHLLWARPTFARYFLLEVPFLSILAAVGFYAMGTRIGPAERPLWITLILAAVLVVAAGRIQYDERDSFAWADFEAAAKKVQAVTPAGATLWADEHIYFLTHRAPPTGEEYEDSQKLTLPKERLARLHVVARADMAAALQAGRFHTAATCDEDNKIDTDKIKTWFKNNATVGDCLVFWNPLGSRAPSLKTPADSDDDYVAPRKKRR